MPVGPTIVAALIAVGVLAVTIRRTWESRGDEMAHDLAFRFMKEAHHPPLRYFRVRLVNVGDFDEADITIRIDVDLPGDTDGLKLNYAWNDTTHKAIPRLTVTEPEFLFHVERLNRYDSAFFRFELAAEAAHVAASAQGKAARAYPVVWDCLDTPTDQAFPA